MRLELQWGNLHRLILSDDDGTPSVTLSLIKNGGGQEIPVALSHGVTLAQISEAWEAQGRVWIDLFEYRGRPFVAVRVIWLPGGLCVMWSLLHDQDAPHDLCAIVRLGRSTWPHGKIVAVAAT